MSDDGSWLRSLGLAPDPFRNLALQTPDSWMLPNPVVSDPFAGMGLPTTPGMMGGDTTGAFPDLLPTSGVTSIADLMRPPALAAPGAGTMTRPLSQPADLMKATRAADQAPPPVQAPGGLWDVIDEVAGDARVALAMKMAAQMESGGRLDAVGDNGQSHGPYQIYQGAHAGRITPEQSRDPRAATMYMLPEFRSAVARVDPALWQSDPAAAAARAAFLAERPAEMYPEARVRAAYSTVAARRPASSMRGYSTSATEEADQQRAANNSPAGVAVSIAQGVQNGSLTPNQYASGLAPGDAASACGPAAAVAFARAFGRTPTLQETVDLARRFGWTQSAGMAGPESQVKLMNAMGIQSRMQNGVDWQQVASQIQAGRPVIFDTPAHYWVAENYDPTTGKFDFGNSALALKASGGRRWLTPQEMEQIAGGGVRSTIYVA